MIEIYAIELKNISEAAEKNIRKGALNPDKLKQKWLNCLNWASDLVDRFKSVKQERFNICNYVVLVVPDIVRHRIVTLIKREGYRYKPSPSTGKIRGRIEGRILSCNTPITGHADIF